MGYLLICLVSLVLGYFAPVQTWRMGIGAVRGAVRLVAIEPGPGNLPPLRNIKRVKNKT